MASPRGKRNAVLAGLLVVAAIVGGIAVVIVVGGGLDALGTNTYTVRFPIKTGVAGLAPGSAVSVGGRSVGTVTELRFVSPDGSEASDTTQLTHIDVKVAVSKRVPLREGAQPELVVPLLGGSGSIDFSDLGDGARLDEADIMEGRTALPGFVAGFVDAFGLDDEDGGGFDFAKLTELVDSVRDGAESFNRVATRFDERVMPEVEQASADARAIVADTRERWPAWLDRVDRATADIESTAARGPELARNVEDRVEQIGALIDNARRVLDDNRPAIDDTVANVRAASEDVRSGAESAERVMLRFENEITDEVAQLIGAGRDAAANAEDVLANANSILDEQRPNIRRGLANFRLTAEQLRITAAELRQSPWRLLYRPNDRELEYELLYDAARAYAGAVSELRAASESLESVAAAGGRVPQDRLDNLVAQIASSFERYGEAERRLLDELIGAGGQRSDDAEGGDGRD